MCKRTVQKLLSRYRGWGRIRVKRAIPMENAEENPLAASHAVITPVEGDAAELGDAGATGGDNVTAGDAGQSTTARTSASAKAAANAYFKDTLEAPRFLSLHRRRYGDAKEELSHIEIGIWLGGVYDYISSAREKLVDTSKMTEREFKNVFSIGWIARRIVAASAAADVVPRGSQGRSRDDTSVSRTVTVPIPTYYMRLTREKQLTFIRFCRETRDRETAEQSLDRRVDKGIREFEKTVAVLRSRIETIGIEAPDKDSEEDAQLIWNDVRKAVTAVRTRHEELLKADKPSPASTYVKLLSELEQLQAQMKYHWCTYGFISSMNRRQSADEVRDVIPETASQIPQANNRRRNYQNVPPELIKDQATASRRAESMVAKQLHKWVRLTNVADAPFPEPLDEHDARLADIKRKMTELSCDMKAFFKDKPLEVRTCFAAFSPGVSSESRVYVEGALPEDYKNSVRTLLETIAGAGFKRKREIDMITLHEMRKPKTGEINRVGEVKGG